ncbi:serendipity locus protein alpha-like [Chrysoperla carnea]|uniref:serendipity locus protein alpha-like n=1 Tax=Chrysoperla carnea TaxID=189513 RepID=UPI001D075F4B|nr:serendipity locus protein alpha-like [Chrysoperla carnea]
MEFFVKDMNVFVKLLNPLNKLCKSLINEYIELTSEECFCEFKIALKQTWENIYFHINTYHNGELNNCLHISNVLTSVVFTNHKLSSWKLYEDFLKKHNLVKPCISILMVESFKNHVFNANECTDKFFEEFEKSNTFNIFLLIIHQIEVCLEILLNVLSNEREADILLKESRKYVLNRLVWCLNFFSNPANHLFNEQPQPGSFMQLMDNALDIIYEIDMETKQDKCFETLNISKAYIEELLSHAMSIAQITLPEECINIKAGSQKVLNEFEQLNFECRTEKRNIPLCNLLVDSVSDALCNLEQRVNVGVLKLLLEVFKNYDEHLLNLKDYCVSSTKVPRSADDLDDLIISFDLQIDRIMHVGLFAVACSTNKYRVLKMRSCLASLESLESELIPAITTYYLEQTIETKTHAEVLIKHWYDMVNTLQDLIHLIVDPIAFTQVVLNSCKDDLEKFESEKNNCTHKCSSDLDEICYKCTLLIRHLNLCIPEIYENIPNNIKDQKRLISDLLHECKCAKKALLDENSLNPASDICYQRIIKRFRILMKYLKKFHASLSDSEEMKQIASETIPKLSRTKIDNILQTEVKPENSKTVGALALLMLRGEILRKERSILYQTPKKTPMKPLTPYHKTPGKSKNVSTSISFARKLSRISSNSFLEDAEINFTDLLKDITANLESTKF